MYILDVRQVLQDLIIYMRVRIIGNETFVAETPGNWITISGQVTDGDGTPVIDAMLEFWQADSNGTYNQTGNRGSGWARCGCRRGGAIV